jgi:TPP-dependent trihydroxycyclohexane-1,2-dione (THcHDO) dehydratase
LILSRLPVTSYLDTLMVHVLLDFFYGVVAIVGHGGDQGRVGLALGDYLGQVLRHPAPPEAITGMLTARLIIRVRFSS